MLLNSIRRIFSWRKPHADPSHRLSSVSLAEALMADGEVRAAINAYRKHLESYPSDVDAMNNLGCCLIDVGDQHGAGEIFQLAFSLDDTFRPALVNYARYLQGSHRSEESIKYLQQAFAYNPDDPNVYAVYAGVALNTGNPELARRYGLKAWLGLFDSLRAANCYLFNSAYADIDEKLLAAEHRFWAETLLPIADEGSSNTSILGDEKQENNDVEKLRWPPVVLPPKQKIRIAYWSPDFRNHSVRYFALPLLENHNKEKFEIVGYCDAPHIDGQTEAISSYCDYFMLVNELSDEKLVKLIRSHEIDVLVELAGHSSANRVNLLQNRLAFKQLTGLGYPPTTGLSSIDGKFIDTHITTKDDAYCYTESPLVLGDSFWCFDPRQKPEILPEPPVCRNGYVTFACAGNIAKINAPMLHCWAKILNRVPDSKLLIRSISFYDDKAVQFVSNNMKQAGIDLGRVSFLWPAGGDDFFNSYNEVDIVLDTFPFNGGTTTCFATYMGVPVLSMEGRSLSSRMGKSILCNLGLNEWVVSSYEEYVEKAVLHARNIDTLRNFRRDARQLYAKTALGNGKVFAEDFERCCLTLLDDQDQSAVAHHKVAALPVEELIERAYIVMRYAQFDAARRIVDYCIREYPDCGIAHVLWTLQWTERGEFVEAIEYLESHLDGLMDQDRFVVLLNIARFNMLAKRPEAADIVIKQMSELSLATKKDAIQLKMLNAYVQTKLANEQGQDIALQRSALRSVLVLVVCNEQERYDRIVNKIKSSCFIADGISVEYKKCDEGDRRVTYMEQIADGKEDVIVVIQKNLDVCSKYFFEETLAALESADILSVGGAIDWDRIEWRRSAVENKVSAFQIPSGEVEGFYEIIFSGANTKKIIDGVSVLDGSFLAINRSVFSSMDTSDMFDPLLLGGAGAYMETYFTHAAFKNGKKLAVHQNLGVIFDWRVSTGGGADADADARWHLTQKMSFDPFWDGDEDRATLSIPVPTAEFGVEVLGRFLG